MNAPCQQAVSNGARNCPADVHFNICSIMFTQGHITGENACKSVCTCLGLERYEEGDMPERQNREREKYIEWEGGRKKIHFLQYGTKLGLKTFSFKTNGLKRGVQTFDMLKTNYFSNILITKNI